MYMQASDLIMATTADDGKTANKRPSNRWTLFIVFLSLLVDLLGFTVILPLIPSMLEYYSTHDQVSVLPLPHTHTHIHTHTHTHRVVCMTTC